MAGRNPKTSAELKLTGGFRADRHGSRADVVWPHDLPEKPADLSDDAAWLWELVLSQLPDAARAKVDAAVLRGMCEWWGLYRRYMNLATEATAEDYRIVQMAAMAWKQFEKSSCDFGLSPAARAKLRVGGKEKAKANDGKGRYFQSA